MELAAPPPEIMAAFGHAPDIAMRRTTGGLINDTFLLGDPPAWVVQRISRSYFHDPEAVMENLVRILGHLDWKRSFDPDAPTERWFPELVHTADNRHYLYDDAGALWRSLRFIPGHAPTRTLDPATLRDAAAMYGRFVAAVEDLGGPPLRPTVDGYRNLDHFAELWRQTRAAHAAQTKALGGLADHVDELVETVRAEVAALGEDAWRLRPVHNDTKLDNLIASTGGEIIAVIDLDVATEGCAAHDFGDLLRSASQQGPDPDRPFNPAVFDVIAAGFIEGAGPTLSRPERRALPAAGPRICIELGLRYLIDHLADTPKLVADRDLALTKARRNLRLAEGMLAARTRLEQTIEELDG